MNWSTSLTHFSMLYFALHLKHTHQLQPLYLPELGCSAALGQQLAPWEAFSPHFQIAWIPLKSSTALLVQVNAATSYTPRTGDLKPELLFRLVTNNLGFHSSAFCLCCSLRPLTWQTMRPTELCSEGSSGFIRGLFFLLSGVGSSGFICLYWNFKWDLRRMSYTRV